MRGQAKAPNLFPQYDSVLPEAIHMYKRHVKASKPLFDDPQIVRRYMKTSGSMDMQDSCLRGQIRVPDLVPQKDSFPPEAIYHSDLLLDLPVLFMLKVFQTQIVLLI